MSPKGDYYRVPGPERAPSVTYTRTNERGEVEVVVRPSKPRHGGRSKHPRSKEEIIAILEAHGLR